MSFSRQPSLLQPTGLACQPGSRFKLQAVAFPERLLAFPSTWVRNEQKRILDFQKSKFSSISGSFQTGSPSALTPSSASMEAHSTCQGSFPKTKYRPRRSQCVLRTSRWCGSFLWLHSYQKVSVSVGFLNSRDQELPQESGQCVFAI